MSTMAAPQEVQIFYDDFEVRRRHSLCLCSSYTINGNGPNHLMNQRRRRAGRDGPTASVCMPSTC